MTVKSRQSICLILDLRIAFACFTTLFSLVVATSMNSSEATEGHPDEDHGAKPIVAGGSRTF